MAEPTTYIVYHWGGARPPHPDARIGPAPQGRSAQSWLLDLTPEALVGLTDTHALMLRKLPNGSTILWLDSRSHGRPFATR